MADRQLISRDELRMNFLKHLQAQDHCEGISDIQVVPLDAPRDGGEMWAVTNPRGDFGLQAYVAGANEVMRKFAGKFQLKDR